MKGNGERTYARGAEPGQPETRGSVDELEVDEPSRKDKVRLKLLDADPHVMAERSWGR